MKDIDEILKNPRFSEVERSYDGFRALISFPMWIGSVICSTGAGWNHVSIVPLKRNYVPSWQDMCNLKDVFFNEDEAVIQIHPPKSEYVNNVENCLHLWQCTYKEMVLPPSVLVGRRKGQTRQEIINEIKEAYEIAGEKFDDRGL